MRGDLGGELGDELGDESRGDLGGELGDESRGGLGGELGDESRGGLGGELGDESRGGLGASGLSCGRTRILRLFRVWMGGLSSRSSEVDGPGVSIVLGGSCSSAPALCSEDVGRRTSRVVVVTMRPSGCRVVAVVVLTNRTAETGCHSVTVVGGGA